MVWAIARYVLIAVAALLLGMVINLVIRNGSRWPTFFNPVFYRFLVEYGSLRWQNFFDPGFHIILIVYGGFHVVTLSVARILSLVFSLRVRSVLYLSVSIVGFLASIYFLNPSKYDGVHLFIICWGSSVLVALDYFWKANARHQQL